MAGRELPAVESKMGLVDVAAVFARYWPGGTPKRESLALVLAQSALETGRWGSMVDWNFGGVKSPTTSRDHTYFWTSECVTKAEADKVIASSTPQAPARLAKDQSKCKSGEVRIAVGPRHPWARFRAFESAEAGARDYLTFLSTRTQAWEVVNTTADAKAFVAALKKARYFTGPEDVYAANVASMQREFLRTLPATIPDVDSIPPARLALPGVFPTVGGTPVARPSVQPGPFVPAVVPPRGSSRGYGDVLAIALLFGAAYLAASNLGGFRVPAFARAR